MMAHHRHVKVSSKEAEPAVFLGLDNRVLMSGEQTGGRFAVVEIAVEPGAGTPPHSNVNESLAFYVLEGTLAFDTEEGAFEASAGDLIHAPPSFRHAFVNQGDEQARVALFMAPAGFENFLVEAATELPDDVPEGPPPEEAVHLLADLGGRYGMELHL
jgi:quercetin dioxygenase-like cupin family protein